ncbi:ABC transporter permease subunit, partial [Nocardia sp. NPDC059691]|uniref:ABC transporter permease subunit n=1 Tax=Nocardia sp. NPDC059691 TaxID=3346908 RepID=UPI00369B5389
MTDIRTAAAPSPVRTLVSQLTPMQVTARAVLRGAVIWGVVFGLVTWLEVVQFAREYPTAADRQRLVMMMGSNVGLDALFGPSPQIDTVGGYAATHAIGVLGIAGAIWALLAATRVLRGEEDAGRWEPLLAGATDRRRATAAALGGLAIGYLVLWTLTAVLFAAAGSQGEARFSASTVLFAATATTAAAGLFLAVGALCSQVAGNRRQAAALAAGVFVVAYLIRVVAYSTTSLRWLRWVTPLGWIDETHPFIRSHWPTLLAVAATTAALLTATVWLAGRRDLGAGLLPA